MTESGDNQINHLRNMFLEDLGIAPKAPDDDPSRAEPGKYFGLIALSRGLITPSQLDEALKKQRDNPDRRIGEVLTEMGILETADLLEVLRLQKKVEPGTAKKTNIGKYFLAEELGHGAWGRVYRAIHEDLLKQVAIKVIIEQPNLPKTILDRFRREAKTAARLQHPNIVGVHDVGSVEDTHFIAMDLVEGTTLKEWLAVARPTLQERLLLLEKVARAIGYAHSQGVVHRDLKPENILVRRDGEPVVVDFGLARPFDEIRLTQEGTVVGTPAYMSPEQVRGEVRLLDARTDIYSIGVILYEAVTGHLPFEGRSHAEVYEQILHTEPKRPTAVRTGIPPDIDTVCGKCLDKDRAYRYGSGEDLADDLHRAALGDPIAATRLGFVSRSIRRIRKRPLLAVAVLALGIGLGAIGFFWRSLLQKGEVFEKANAIQAAYRELDTRLRRQLRDVEVQRYAVDPGFDVDAYLATIDKIVNEVDDSEGVGDAFRSWFRFLLKDLYYSDDLAREPFAMLTRARGNHPDNPILVLYSARAYLRKYVDRLEWPDRGMAMIPVSDPLGDLLPDVTPTMKEWLTKAGEELSAANTNPMVGRLREMQWVAGLVEGLEQFAAGNLGPAIERLENVRDLEAFEIEARLLLGLAYCTVGRLTDAVDSSRVLLERRPKLRPATELLARCLRLRASEQLAHGGDPTEDLREARALFASLDDESEIDARVLAVDALVAGQLAAGGKEAEAAAEYRKLVSRYRDRFDFGYQDARSYANYANCLTALAQLTRDRNDSSELYDRALKAMERAKNLGPHFALVRAGLAGILLQRIRLDLITERDVSDRLVRVHLELNWLEEHGYAQVQYQYLRAFTFLMEGKASRTDKERAVAMFRKATDCAEKAVEIAPKLREARYLGLAARMEMTRIERPPAGDVLALIQDVESWLDDAPPFNPAWSLVPEWIMETAVLYKGKEAAEIGSAGVRLWARSAGRLPDVYFVQMSHGAALLAMSVHEPDRAADWILKAIRRLEEVERKWPNEVTIYNRLNEAYAAGMKIRSVSARKLLLGYIDMWRRAVKAHPDQSEFLFNLGLTLKFMRVHDREDPFRWMLRALEVFADVESKWPDHKGALTEQAELYAQLGAASQRNPDQLKKYLDKGIEKSSMAIRLDPKDPLAYILRSRFLAATGKGEGALRDAIKAVELAPELARAQLNLGLLYVQADRWEEAHAHFDKGRRNAKDEVQRAEADVVIRGTLRLIRQAIEEEGDKPGLWILLARYQLTLGRADDARKSLETALKHATDDAQRHQIREMLASLPK